MPLTGLPTTISPADPGATHLLAELFAQAGPFASVYLPADSEHADSIERFALLAANAGRALADQDWPQPAAHRIRDTLVELGPHGGATSVAIATPEAVLLTGHLADPYRERATVDALPDVAPLLDSAARTIPHVVVLADRAGADVFSVAAPGRSEATRVEGDTEFIHRGHYGGWSERRFQQRAENTWEQNAKEVVDEVRAAVKEIDAGLIVAAGDVRAIGFIRQSLGALANRLVEIEGSRHTDPEVLAPRVTDVVASEVATRQAASLAHLREEVGSGRGSSAADDVIVALRRGAVETLYLAPGVPAGATAVFSVDNPMLIALQATELEDLASSESFRAGALQSAVLRSAIAQGSHIEMVPNASVLGDNKLAATFRFDFKA